ncbi:hypothetical protein OPV22_000191 [Ensete ventricosum]|uniref:Glutaredoxin domain-containing protein n=1 Tax=Ensete ventricosum TaxID=4639 RepID=A0AAV8RMI5_ENSVE|nr:hypothetical protein OPV22_000191 [Ensete ventricosum]RWW11417.1 hypothetical protein GW17_00024976 [Ensete ventricosum]
MDRVMRLASQRAAVVFSLSSCCMCYTIKRLFCDLGVNPAIHELDEDPNGKDMEGALTKWLGCNPPCSSAAALLDQPTGSCPFTSVASSCRCSVTQERYLALMILRPWRQKQATDL